MEKGQEINELLINLQSPKKRLLNDISNNNPTKSLKTNGMSDHYPDKNVLFKMPTSASMLGRSNFLLQTAQKSNKPLNSYTERYKLLLSTANSKKSYCSTFKPSSITVFNENKSQASCLLSQSTFFLGKKTMRTSEELALDKIRKSKEEARNAIKNNKEYYQSHRKYTPLPVQPSPLTLIKPFNLSSSSCSEYLKKRMVNTPNEIREINKKIKEKLVRKCEDYENQLKKKQIDHPCEVLSYEITKTPEMLRWKKDGEKMENQLSLSARINQYCAIASEILQAQARNETNEERDINNKTTK